MSNMELTDFLLARIAEDEAAARAAIGPGGPDWRAGHDYGDGGDVWAGEQQVIYDEGLPTMQQADHIVRWDPARVLAECEAKRRMVGVVQERNLELLASPYADHPDYRQEWAP